MKKESNKTPGMPNVILTKLITTLPKEAKIIQKYEIGENLDKSIVTILKTKDNKYIYHLISPESSLDKEKEDLLNQAKNIIISSPPKFGDDNNPESIKRSFFNISLGLIGQLAETKKIKINNSELNKLAKIFVRNTIGFGVIEVLLQDNNLEDISINSPVSANPIILKHQKYKECTTNIFPSEIDGEVWAPRFRMISGKPLDEENPILNANISLENIKAEITIKLSQKKFSYNIRRK